MNKLLIISIITSCISLCAIADESAPVSNPSETRAKTVNDAVTNSIRSGSSAKISAKSITLFNYVLQKKIVIENPYSLSVMDGGQFVPQIHEFLALYAEHTTNNIRPIEAIMLVHTSDLAMDFIKKASDVTTKK